MRKSKRANHSRPVEVNPLRKSWIQENLLTILALVIALSGGVPGCINLIDYLNKKPVFSFKAKAIGVSVYTIQQEKKNVVHIALAGSLFNSGEKPLFVDRFELYVKINGEKVKATSLYMKGLKGYVQPNGTVFEGDQLHLVKKIDPSEPMPGVFFFFLPLTYMNENLASRPFQLVCIDLGQTTYKTEWITLDHDRNKYMSNPKEGVNYNPALRDSIYK